MIKIALMLLSIPQFAWSASIGTITEQVAAPPSIQRSSSNLTGAKGTGVEMMDSIKTQRGKVGITFQDNTKVQINEGSKLVIDDFVYDPKAKTGKLSLNMAMGTVRYASGQIAKNDPQRVNINTPTATIAVRGTDFTATIDELGASTIILLPSCPPVYRDVERDCHTGSIEVITDAGKVLLDQAFQATKVVSRGIMPLKPVRLNLSEDAINNMLIVSPPKQLTSENDTTKIRADVRGALDIDFLKETGLVNVLDQQVDQFVDKLSRNMLDQNFLSNILYIINAQLAAQLDLLNKTSNSLLPDYTALSGVVAEVDDLNVTLSRNDGSNVQSVMVPKNQNSTIYQIQGSVEIKNRVNTGSSTTITLKQN